MATPFLGEIKIVSFNFPPKGWAECNGQLLPINQNQALFSLLGTTYGGDGRVNFALPDLRSRAQVHMGSQTTLGERSGEENHTLIISEMAAHTHLPSGNSSTANAGLPTNNTWAADASNPYSNTVDTTMNPAAVLATGGSQPHVNMQPYLVLNIIIALQGIFPSQN